MKKYTLILFLLVKSFVFSELILDINDTTLVSGETAILSVVVKDQKLSNFEIEGIENFKVLSKGQSSSTQITNGKKSSSKTYQYRILPLADGEFELKVVGNYKKDKFESNILNIEVKQSFERSEVDLNFYMESNIPKEKYYFGEKIILSEHLITTVNLEGFGFVDNAKYSDFTEKDITQKGYEGKMIRINGKKAADYTVYKAILEPLRSGEFIIPSRTFQVNTRDTSSIFSDIKPHYLQTKAKEVEILELPETDKPNNFSGAIGVVKADYKFDKTEADFGEAITLIVKLRGNANLDTLQELISENIPGIKVYQNVKDIKEYVAADNYTVEKDYEIVFIPQNSGDLTIPEIKIPYFNTNTEKYDEIILPKQILSINGATVKENTDQLITQNFQNAEITVSQINTVNKEESAESYLVWLIILAVTNLITLIALIVLLFKNKKAKETGYDFKQLKNKIKKSNNINELYNLYNEAIKLKFSLSIKSYSSEQITREIGEEKGIEIANIIKELEALKYFNKTPNKELKEKMIKTL